MRSRFIRLLGNGALASASLILYAPAATPTAPTSTVRGVVAGTRFVPPSGTTPSRTSTAYFRHARVCFDANDNGACDPSESSTLSDDTGSFVLTGAGRDAIVAEISRDEASAAVPGADRLVFRSAPDAAAASTPVAVTPLSTEILRLMEADRLPYKTARAQLAARLGISVAEAASDPAIVTAPASRRAVLAEAVTLSRRFGLAAKMVDRQPPMTMKDAQQAAMALEGIPRYDYIFIITLENKAATVIRQSPLAPHINAYLDAGNEFTSYYATGNPSEPNRIVVSSGDDFGVTDDNAWNCVPEGDTANLPEDVVPAGRAALRQRNESQPEAQGQPLHRDDGRWDVMADVQRIDESGPRLAAQRRRRSDARRRRSPVSRRQSRRRPRHHGPARPVSRVLVHDQAQRHGVLSGAAELT